MADVDVDVTTEVVNVAVTQAPDFLVDVTMAGAQGPQGVQGPQGPTGPAGSGDKNYSQSITSQTSVTVNHNLGKFPSVTVLDTAGDECEGAIDHLNANSLTLSFSAAFSGSVYCN